MPLHVAWCLRDHEPCIQVPQASSEILSKPCTLPRPLSGFQSVGWGARFPVLLSSSEGQGGEEPQDSWYMLSRVQWVYN